MVPRRSVLGAAVHQTPSPEQIGLTVATTIDRAFLSALAPFDALRNQFLRSFGRLLKPLIARREPRVVVLGAFGLGVAFALTLTVPLWLLTMGPLVLGIPHLVADLRYLVMRPSLHRRPGFLLWVGVPLVATLFEPRLWIGLLSVAGAALLARTAWSVRAGAALAGLAIAWTAWMAGGWVSLLFAHAHNGIAFLLWWQWRPARPRMQWWVLALFGAGLVTLAVGGDEAVFRLGSLEPPGLGLDVESLAWGLAPPGIAPDWMLRLLLIFAFAQAAHYAVWTRLIPDDARPRPGLRSFAGSYRALVADCGRPLVIVAFLIAGGLIVWTLFDLAVARATYLRLALFHGPLELAVASLWAIEGRAAIIGSPAA